MGHQTPLSLSTLISKMQLYPQIHRTVLRQVVFTCLQILQGVIEVEKQYFYKLKRSTSREYYCLLNLSNQFQKKIM